MQILRYGVKNLEIYKLTISWSALKINIGFYLLFTLTNSF